MSLPVALSHSCAVWSKLVVTARVPPGMNDLRDRIAIPKKIASPAASLGKRSE
jgi:hypothetical protein